MDPRIPQGGLRRTVRLVGLPATHAGRVALGIGRRLGGQPAAAVAAEVQARTAAQLFRTLGELKGGAMKLGQAMSAMEALLPAELAGPYREALTLLQEAAPALPTPVVHRVLAEDLGQGWRDLFRTLDDRPAAAASIGQVHRGRWHDGTDVAVKVQYPGAFGALATDLRQLDRVVPLGALGAPGIDLRDLFAELRHRMLDEVDYEQEAVVQRAFAAAFAGDPDIAVPEVVEARPRVLVTRWMQRRPLADVMRTGTAGERDRAGLLLLRFFLSAPARVGRIHGDPHPGNFGLLGDGRLGVVDFGSSEEVPGGWPPRLGEVLRAARDRDAGALHAAA
ncbi:MAG TPA: AarF/ABC1/UbiB kinase family protein, partial [Acidimicrobiales bacterium]|nr:AarF/ABC1/UbiB kinase family protein [Acidimicrobiales bacterium]